ncbi:DNA primase [Desulfolucanica intricata]|uniref:DNA primase n=1 Tax=Desulfolucanica intricata TaxID=1285191 RepID=UPI00082CE36D|nr:DNA primase [Desulfolucanica intricata]
MGGIIPQEIIEEVRVRTDIVQVISDYVPLTKKGQNYVGPCPFHYETKPSFTVSPEKQIFYCFGCNAGGNVFRFLMLKEALSFPEAVKKLALLVRVDIPEGQDAQNLDKILREQRTWKINNLVKEFYRYILSSHKIADPARKYLVKRGISVQSQELFQLGYAPPKWDGLTKFLQKKHNFSPEELVSLGLSGKNKSGRFFDRFRHRLVFPITNVQGQIVGFGGRALEEQEDPKYLNSPETEYFNKRCLLYGLHLAKQHIRKKGFAVIMEGYMDVITAHQYGIKNSVASLGTSLTAEQGKLLMRYAKEVVLAYDADQAGMKATLRGMDILQKLGFRVRVVTTPEGKDPDDFIRLAGAGAFEDLINNSTGLIEYKLEQFKKDNGWDSGNKALAVQSILPNLANIKGAVEREDAVKRAAGILNVSWEAILSDLQHFSENNTGKRLKSGKIAKNKYSMLDNGQNKMDAREKAEQGLLILVLEKPSLVDNIKSELGDSFFRNRVYQKIFDVLSKEHIKPNYQSSILFNFLNDEEQNTLSHLLMKKIPGDNLVQIISDFVSAVKRSMRKERKEKLLKKLAELEKNGDRESMVLILEELQHLY